MMTPLVKQSMNRDESWKALKIFKRGKKGASLQEGWVIANHILVSFHVAFISSVLSLPSISIVKSEVLRFIFVSPETLVSALFMLISFHTGIAVHELGHYRTATRLNALNDASQQEAARLLQSPLPRRLLGMARLFFLAPYGKASGIKREGLNYYPDAPYNLAVAAAGPRTSRNLALAALPPALVLLVLGIGFGSLWATYLGRLCLGIGVVGLLDFFMADPGKYKEFKNRERLAQEKAATVTRTSAWWDAVADAKKKMLGDRIQSLIHPRLGPVTAPWQFRNCGMGGRHTEKEYPESNISMQEAMFLILGAQDYQEAQEMTVRLQNRLKEIIENEEGCRVMGIGLEGGLAPYIERGSYPLPEVRLWAMMKRTIEECGYEPGTDVAIALDPAMSELEIAYRKQFNVPDSVGMYLFWRDKTQLAMDRDGILELYKTAIQEYDIPILSIEDGFSEDDHEGWQKLLEALGDRIFVIGDDLVTTNDRTIEIASAKSLINTVLVKANQIGTLYETILAMLVTLGKGLDIVVSHRSKSPNDDMEAQIALAVNSLGLKAGGGANTERLVKYHAVTELMERGMDDADQLAMEPGLDPVVRKIFAYEEPTNAGIPSVGATVELVLPKQGVQLKFKGATPLGTSAGTGEAIHLVDSSIEAFEHREVMNNHGTFFKESSPGVFAFDKKISAQQIQGTGDDDLAALYNRAQRYEGKGCLNAVDNVTMVIAPVFEGMVISDMTIKEIDQTLLSLEVRVAQRRGKMDRSASRDEAVRIMQSKQNLGMNAILSVSLAMARAVAHLQGKSLFEVIREEMFAIIERLAGTQGVEIEGSRFDHYVSALQASNNRIEEAGGQLYETLREMTGIYEGKEETSKPGKGRAAPKEGFAEILPNAEADGKTSATDGDGIEPAAEKSSEPATPRPSTQPLPDTLLDEEKVEIAELNNAFYDVFRSDAGHSARSEVLRRYVQINQHVMNRVGHFGLVNSRIYLGPDGMLIPYILGNSILVYRLPGGSPEPDYSGLVPVGTIITDAFVKNLARFDGDPIDLDNELFELDTGRCKSVHVVRIRDMATQLQRISKSANSADAKYLLRLLVARLSLFSFKKYLSAKNLQAEVRNLISELVSFLNSPLSYRLPFLVRILVRNIAGVVTKPKLIDRLWNDTIDLAEVHLRGSDIVNEIRRSTHHAVGKRTLTLVGSYLEYLESGNTEGLAQHGYPEPGPADEEARGKSRPREILARVLADLEELLGNSDVLSRIREWQGRYTGALIRCESDTSLVEEVEKVVTDCIGERNRWTFYHHIRIIRNRIAQFPHLSKDESSVMKSLKSLLELKPDDPDFDPRGAESELRRAVDDFMGEMHAAYRDELFAYLEKFTDAFLGKAFFETFTSICALRKYMQAGLTEQAFPEQRLLLYELDSLLEEMGYVTLRHVASRYEEDGVDLAQCLRIIDLCALNLTYGGLYSRQTLDLAGMLTDRSYTYAELMNVLQQIQRNYQSILRRLIEPFESMQDRLDLDEEELRIALANMQRFLHDLNSLAFFADTALSHIEHNISDLQVRVDGKETSEPGEGPQEKIVHLSHIEEIRALLEPSDHRQNVLARYGGKGSGLIYIKHLYIPTTDGFIIPTDVARRRALEKEDNWLDDAVQRHLEILESDLARDNGEPRRFGRPGNPLLLAVRSGSVFSMPGILATIVFVGMNDDIADMMAEDDPWHAYDSYRRFLSSYGQAVWGVDLEEYHLVEKSKEYHGVKYKSELPWEAMRDITESTKDILRKDGFGDALEEALQDPSKQLMASVRAVFDSWNHETARNYRAFKGLCDTWQSAVIVQEMAMGNRSNSGDHTVKDETNTSLTGVIPRTTLTELGERVCTGEFKFSACGDDLVGGLTKSLSFSPLEEMKSSMPMLSRRLYHTVCRLSRFMGTDQEIEFTVDRGILSVLQTRSAQIGTNKVINGFQDPGEETTLGIGIRGSAFRGVVAFNETDYEELRASNLEEREDVDGILLVLENPTPADIPLVLSADGLLASKGGSTSHAAIAINSIEHKDYYAVMSADGLRVNTHKQEAVIVDEEGNTRARISKGDVISIHGATGAVFIGSRPLESK